MHVFYFRKDFYFRKFLNKDLKFANKNYCFYFFRNYAAIEHLYSNFMILCMRFLLTVNFTLTLCYTIQCSIRRAFRCRMRSKASDEAVPK